MSKISIGQVMSRMNEPVVEGKEVTFALTYVTAEGEIKRVRKMQAHYKLPQKGSPKREQLAAKSFGMRLKENHSILLYNHDDRKYNTVRFSLMTHYNTHQIDH